jgi:HipA-like C-terminal domain
MGIQLQIKPVVLIRDTAPETFEVAVIEPEWVLQVEEMGSKNKFWFRRSDDAPRWLFKYPQPDTGQHWAEKVAAEIAALMGVFHAKVDLAVFQGDRGSATESFARGGRNLFHGNQILAGNLFGYDSNRRFRQSEHTLENIFEALDKTFETNITRRLARLRLADYLVLDAVIGNTDRHHENWGILRRHLRSGWTGSMAPSFDHASSLGRELLDNGTRKSKQRLLDEDRIANYSEKARGAIYWSSDDKHGLSPLELVRRAVVRYPESFLLATRRVEALSMPELQGILSRMPAGWMSETAANFVRELLMYNINELRKLNR